VNESESSGSESESNEDELGNIRRNRTIDFILQMREQEEEEEEATKEAKKKSKKKKKRHYLPSPSTLTIEELAGMFRSKVKRGKAIAVVKRDNFQWIEELQNSFILSESAMEEEADDLYGDGVIDEDCMIPYYWIYKGILELNDSEILNELISDDKYE
jgi:hypothetical protein